LNKSISITEFLIIVLIIIITLTGISACSKNEINVGDTDVTHVYIIQKINSDGTITQWSTIEPVEIYGSFVCWTDSVGKFCTTGDISISINKVKPPPEEKKEK